MWLILALPLLTRHKRNPSPLLGAYCYVGSLAAYSECTYYIHLMCKVSLSYIYTVYMLRLYTGISGMYCSVVTEFRVVHLAGG